MKTLFHLFSILSCLSVQASLMISIPSPQDNTKLKYSLWLEPTVSPSLETDRKELYDLEETLRTLKESRLLDILGPEISLDDSYVLPFCRHTNVGFSGLGYKAEEQRYFLPIGDLGGVLVFPYGERDYISAVALYLKADKTFHPLEDQGDLKARREWDRDKLSKLKRMILHSIKSTEQGAAANP